MKLGLATFATVVWASFPVATAETCVKMVTGGVGTSHAQGYVKVWIDSGNGLEVEVPKTFFADGEIVLDKCFPQILDMAVRNRENNGWAGSIKFDVTCDDTFVPGSCVSGCESAPSSTETIAVDGDDDPWSALHSQCLEETRCRIEPPAPPMPTACCSYNQADCTSLSACDWCHEQTNCEGGCNGYWIPDTAAVPRTHCCSHNGRDCHYNDGDFCQSQYTCESGGCGSDTWWLEKNLPVGSCVALHEACTDDVNGCCSGLECVGNASYRQCRVPSP